MIDRSMAQGFLTPSLDNRPQLKEGNALIWDAFVATTTSRLTSTRHGKNGPYAVREAIQLDQLVAYCDLVGIEGSSQRRRIVALVHAVDVEYLEAINPRG